MTNESKNGASNSRYHVYDKAPGSAILISYRNRSNVGWASIPSVLKACAALFNLGYGWALHGESIKLGVDCDVKVATSLVDMYGKCREITSARKVFDNLREGNAISWNAMIGGFVRNGDMESAMGLFNRMEGKTSVTWNEMIGGYARGGAMAKAMQVFDSVPQELKNVVTWTEMVGGFVRNGDMVAAEAVFEAMPERNFFVWSVMVSGYFKIGAVAKGKELFDRMDSRNLVTWNCLISGYAQNAMWNEGLNSFMSMLEEGFEPDSVTVVSVLSICAQAGMLGIGKELHEMILRKGIDLNEFVLSGLADMYAKCGDLSSARLIFERMSFRNRTTWNAFIAGYAIDGRCNEALDVFARMEKSGVKPDSMTFLSVLSACAHGGLMEEGLEVISKMEKYGVTVNKKHYGCLVDLLGRAGELQEALSVVRGMPMQPNETVLGSLLGACRVHSNAVMAESVAELVQKQNANNHSRDHSHRVLLSNVYAACEKWEMAERTRSAFSGKGSIKVQGCSTLGHVAYVQ